MKIPHLLYASILFILLMPCTANAESRYVTSQQEFDSAQNSSAANDTIVWRTGTYSDIFMDIEKARLTIKAEEFGSVIFNGDSRVDISADYINLIGFQFIGGDIGTSDVINTRGSYNIFHQINIRAYTSYKYLRVREESQYCEITYCNFENRINKADQNILSILVDENQPGYHKIQHCSFKNFAGGGNDEGVEPIRVGVSTQANFNSRTLVEYCYFTKCDGDGELISSKASQNVYRFNTFDSNPKAELVLRHGSEAIVYGNFFLNGKGGVRIREGQNHYIYNNYFQGINDRTIYIQNEDSDPLDNINIAFNTISNCDEIRLGGSGNDKPTNVTFANNIFTNPNGNLFQDPTGTETWISNIAFGNLGMNVPSSGVTVVNPNLVSNSASFFGLADDSPAIAGAESGYKPLPQFDGMDPIDTEVLFDLMGQNRPAAITDRDLGCNEHPHETLIQPIATEENTGPSYNTTTATSVRNNSIIVDNILTINPNPVINELTVSITNSKKIDLKFEVFNIEGELVGQRIQSAYPNDTIQVMGTFDLAAGVYILRASSLRSDNGITRVQNNKFIVLK